ncbi:MAG: hypothetical protein IJC48_01795 [Clostridia bacterium]|nr:hypothetical protein [Clostridia bacterium]
MEDQMVRLITKLAPDLMEEIVARAMVLERISVLQPVGRRALAQRMRLPEREARVITDALRQTGWIEATAAGMTLTNKAYELLDSVREFVHSTLGIESLEIQLQKLLGVERVKIVPGNAEESKEVLSEVGRVAGAKLRKAVRAGDIVAVTGGTTIQQVALHIPRGANMDVTVIPARGGLGQSVETQANTLAEEIAGKLGGRHMALYVPDNLSPDALKELKKLNEVSEPLALLKHADVLLYGIARADDMAKNRLMNGDDRDEMIKKGATAEALGFCFDAEGRFLAAASGVGVPIDAVDGIPTVIAVATGARKAEAILAVARHHKHSLLVIDESAALKIAELIRSDI